MLANKEVAENSNISNPDLDTKGQDYGLGKKVMLISNLLKQGSTDPGGGVLVRLP